MYVDSKLYLAPTSGPTPEVHEEDLVLNYEILKEFLLTFARAKLPSAEDQKVLGQPQCCGSMGNHVSQKKGYIKFVFGYILGPMSLGERTFPNPRQLLPCLP